MTSWRQHVLIGLSALTLLVSATAIASHLTKHFSCYTSECWRKADVIEHPRELPAISLQDSSGNTAPLQAWRGKVVVVNFVYTRCKTVCSSAGNVSSQLATRLAAEIKQGKVEVVSVSFDPAHDTPEHLSAYKQRLDRSQGLWRVARPISSAANKAMMRTFGVVAIDDGLGGFDHNAALHVVDKNGRLVRIHEINALEEVENDVKKML